MKFDMMSKEEQDTYIRHLDAIANEKEAILTAKIWGKIEDIKEGKSRRRKNRYRKKKQRTVFP